MGCRISIFHEEWFTDPGPDDDWRKIIAADPELRLVDVAEVSRLNGDVVKLKLKGLVEWTKYSGAKRKPAFFFINKGRIVALNADNEILHKTLDIASKLKAKVEGVDGETFVRGRTGKIAIKNRIKAAVNAASWWQF